MEKRYLFIFLILSLCLILYFNYYTSFFIFTTKATHQSFSASILVDTFPPNIILTSPLNITYNTTSIDLNYSVTDSASGVNTTWYNLNNGQNITITSNTSFSVNSRGGNTLYVFANDSAGLENNTEYIAFYVTANKTVVYSEFTGHLTTNFSQYDDDALESLTDVVLHIPDYGKIDFMENINISDLTADLDSYIDIANNSIYLDPDNLPNFNKSARLQLYNLTFTNPRILKDGSVCSASICTKESYENNVLTFNVTGFSNYSAEETPTEQPSPAPSAGGGGGGHAVVYSDFTVEPDIVKVKLKPGDTDTKHLKIKNIGKNTLSLDLKLSITHDLAVIAENKLVLEEGQEEEVTLVFSVGKDEAPGAYAGNLVIEGKGIKKRVLIVVEVESVEKLLDVKLELPPSYKIVRPGNPVYGNIELFNMGAFGRIDVILKYGIKDSEGKVLIQESSVVSVETQASVVRYVVLPLDIKRGKYVIFVEAYYDGTVATSTAEFDVVGEELPKAEIIKSSYLLIGGTFIFLTFVMMFIVMFRLMSSMKQRRKVGGKFIKVPTTELKVPLTSLDEQEKLLEDAYKAGLISEKAYLKDKERIRQVRNK